MAGRILVVRIDDKADAANWARHFDTLPRAETIGMYLLPTIFCACKHSRAEAKNSTLSKKYAIFVCRHCKRPSQYWVKGIPIRLRMALGKTIDEIDAGV